MQQAIVTKYLSPTNTRGARIRASCQAGSIIIPFDFSLDLNACHLKAVHALLDKLGWKPKAISMGWLPSNNAVFVFTN